MVLKLSPKQQSQLAFLALLPPKFQRLHSVIEQMGGNSADETIVRGLIRILDETKSHASQLSLNGLADACSNMAATARRGGGQQVKVRGLRDCLGSVRMNYDAAMKKASVPEAHEPDQPS
jgi:hypothetical protein